MGKVQGKVLHASQHANTDDLTSNSSPSPANTNTPFHHSNFPPSSPLIHHFRQGKWMQLCAVGAYSVDTTKFDVMNKRRAISTVELAEVFRKYV